MTARRIVLVLSAATVIAAGLLVPMPFVEYSPGSAPSVEPLLSVDAPVTELNGELAMLVVWVKQPSLAELVRARYFDHDRSLRPREQIIPDNVDRTRYFDDQRLQFRVAFEVATAVGQRAAGYAVELVTAAEITLVLPEGPSAGQIEPGDRIVAVRGEPVSSAEEAIDLLDELDEGERVSLRLSRDDRERTVSVEAATIPELGRPGLGVGLQTVEIDIEQAVDVQLLDQQGIGGNSAGLMLALTVYDLLADEDLAAGRTIVGTGTVDADGNIGRIGAIEQKVATAVKIGADLVLVPESQRQTALDAAAGRIQVVAVATFDEALTALRAGA
jgi:PDZ domain-containing protein